MSRQTRLQASFCGRYGPMAALVLILSGMANIAIARPADITPEELALSPRYCPHTQSFGRYTSTAEGRQWAARLGEHSFAAMHHYCWGQINYQRALRSSTPQQEKRFLLGEVRRDYLYVTKAASKGFVLLPEIYTRLGEVEIRLVKITEAEASFAKARALKPDYWPAYSHWAEYLIANGKENEAKKLVEAGLKYSPTSKVLRAQQRLLNGD